MTKVCPICGKELSPFAHHNARYCSIACRKKAKSNMEKERRECYAEHGLCIHCGAETKNGKRHCQNCISNAHGYLAIKQERWRENHKCLLCGKKLPPNLGVVCIECLERQRKRQVLEYYERLVRGLCTRCGQRKATHGHKTCEQCRVRYYKEYERKKVA